MLDTSRFVMSKNQIIGKFTYYLLYSSLLINIISNLILNHFTVFLSVKTISTLIPLRWLMRMAVWGLVIEKAIYPVDWAMKKSTILSPAIRALWFGKPAMRPLVLESVGTNGFLKRRESWRWKGPKLFFTPPPLALNHLSVCVNYQHDTKQRLKRLLATICISSRQKKTKVVENQEDIIKQFPKSIKFKTQ